MNGKSITVNKKERKRKLVWKKNSKEKQKKKKRMKEEKTTINNHINYLALRKLCVGSLILHEEFYFECRSCKVVSVYFGIVFLNGDVAVFCVLHLMINVILQAHWIIYKESKNKKEDFCSLKPEKWKKRSIPVQRRKRR